MGVKPGFKQTEVGVIPEDWEVKSIHEFAVIKTGPFGTILKASEYSGNSGVPLVSVGEIREGFLKITDKTPHVPEAVVRRLPQYVLKKGDIVFGRKGGVERSALIREEEDGWFLGSDGISIRPSKQCHDKYLALQFQSRRIQGWLIQNATGTTMASLNQRILRDVGVPLPPNKAEQEVIAEALSDMDALIEYLEQLIAKKRQIKQGAMQELLTGKKWLPGFSGGWEVKTFGNVFDYHSTATNSRSDLKDDGDTFYIHYGDIHTRFHNHLDFRVDQPPRIDRQRCENATLLHNGDWIMADASEDFDGVGKLIEVQGLGIGISAVAGLHTFLLREKTPTFAPGFKGHVGNLKSLHDQFLRVATGMKVYGVSKTALKDLILHIPSIAEQEAIAAILSDMDAEITALETKLVKYRQIKQGMMQNLLTGRIRLV